jgi:hypothetical protein
MVQILMQIAKQILMQIPILILMLIVLPTYIGGIVANMGEKKVVLPLPFRWVCGQFMMWSGFQLICVPLILQEKPFHLAVLFYLLYIVALAAIELGMSMKQRAKRMSMVRMRVKDWAPTAHHVGLWTIFFVLLLFQLIQAIRLAYGDGDDAFYVAISTITEDADSMYMKVPYTGGFTGLDARYGLAPFPIWVAFLSRISDIRAVTIAHIILPLMLIPMTYAIYYLIGSRLFKESDEKLPLFLIFTEILVLFGDYSFSTAENFMLARSRQGKAALGNIVIPFVLLLLIRIMEEMKEKKKVPYSYYVLLVTAAVAACLCSTMGALLICMLTGVAGIFGALYFKAYREMFKVAACCLPCVGFAFLYLLLG